MLFIYNYVTKYIIYSIIIFIKFVNYNFSVLAFHPNIEKGLIFAAGDDIKIHGWNIKTGKKEITLSGHFSKVTSLSFLKDENYLVR